MRQIRDGVSWTGRSTRYASCSTRPSQQERSALFPDPSDDARFREQQLDELPRSTAQAVQELRDYDWRSPQARETYDQIGELLRARCSTSSSAA